MGFFKKISKKIRKGTKKHVLRPIRHNFRLLRRGHVLITTGTNGSNISITN